MERCGFCYDREQGKHGEIKREFSFEWMMMLTLCRKHSIENDHLNDEKLGKRGARKLAAVKMYCINALVADNVALRCREVV